MNKPKSLREALTIALPEIRQNPERLQIFIESGQLAATQAQNFSFIYHYTLSVLIIDFSNHVDTIFIPLMVWLREYQPDLLTGQPDGGIGFDAEIVSNTATDIEIKLKLTETVVVTAENGKLVSRHLPEPPLMDTTGDTGWEMLANEETVQQTPIEVIE
jgi:P2 phage tail completion protein R (GpR).